MSRWAGNRLADLGGTRAPQVPVDAEVFVEGASLGRVLKRDTYGRVLIGSHTASVTDGRIGTRATGVIGAWVHDHDIVWSEERDRWEVRREPTEAEREAVFETARAEYRRKWGG